MSPHPLITQLRAFIRLHTLIRPASPVLLAVSGGPDSLAMLYALAELRRELDCDLQVAHLDHLLRGVESAAEASFVAAQADLLGLPAIIERQDIAQLALERRMNLYAAGRAARYSLLARAALEIGAQAVAVAHTAADQAETVLMHLLRGAGPEGLSGMRPSTAWEEWREYAELRNRRTAEPLGQGSEGSGAEEQKNKRTKEQDGQTQEPRTKNQEPSSDMRQGDKEIISNLQSPISNPQSPGGPTLIRPLLNISRATIEDYCRAQGLEPRRDPSNTDTRHRRSSVRHRLMPALIEYNPGIINALCRTAETIAAEHDLVGQLLDTAWTGLARSRPGAVDLDRALWSGLHPALQRAALRRAYAELKGGETLGLDDVERVRVAAGRAPGRLIELPGNLAVRITQAALLVGAPPAEDGPQLIVGQIELDVPSVLDLEHGWHVAVTVEPPRTGDTRWEAWLSYPIEGTLSLRRRRSGERMHQPGRQGSRRIQDLMVDARLPRVLRDAWPLLTIGDTVVWIPGVTALGAAQLGEQALCVRVAQTIDDSER